MIKSLKKLFEKLSGAKSASARVILLGIDYPSHTLGRVLKERGAEITAFIDDEPWNHRTKMLGATVHYPSEVVALAKRYAVSEIVMFAGNKIELENQVSQQLQQLNLKVTVIDSNRQTLEQQVAGILGW